MEGDEVQETGILAWSGQPSSSGNRSDVGSAPANTQRQPDTGVELEKG